jgi:hypothetical protein
VLGPDPERDLGRDRDRRSGLGDVRELLRRSGSDAATG